jgi:MFS superfamily sulfate permease-like transporter
MNSKKLFADFKSSIVVFLVALPLCLGIALACGFPLFSGIIAGLVGGIIVASISDSRYSVSGPAAGLTAIVLSSVSQLGSIQVFLAAVVFAGILQILLGIFKAGGIGNFIPSAVIKGMLAGIGMILIIKQFPHFVGYDADPEGDMYFDQPDGHNSFTDLYYMLNYITPGSVVIGCISFLVLLITDRPFYKKDRFLSMVPGPLLVVVFGILLNVSFRSYPFLLIGEDHLVSLPVINSADDLKANLLFPDFGLMGQPMFWTVVFTVGIVASLETLLSIEAIEKLDPEKHPVNSNRELIAQGIGNIGSALVGGLPVTSVIVRSSANIHAGARSKFSAIFHAMLLLVCVLLFPKVLGLIPNSSLAVILIMTGYKLTKVSLFKEQFRGGWDQFLPFVVTIAVMLTTDLLKGVAAGILLAVFFIIRSNIKSSFEIIEEIIDHQTNYLIKLPQHITFFNKGFMINFLEQVKKNSRVIIDGSITKSVDKDVKEVLADFIENSKQKNIQVQLIKYHI